FAKSQDWLEFTASETIIPEYTVLTSNDTLVEFEVIIPGMYSAEIDTFSRIDISKHYSLDSTGYPETPVVSFIVAIPECDSINYSVSITDSL
ncbi:MAG: hypothetical protein K8R68_05010, partial [Bacteroidales bacterium]|nr:hypothetical protein [Bacteroidales bacterium]